VLDGILRAQANGEKIGALVTPQNRRFHQLQDSTERCFN
jgi:hypothetical protein